MNELTIPVELLPTDGRFGCGPSKVRNEQLRFLASLQPGDACHSSQTDSRCCQTEKKTPLPRGVLGTSHRQAPVKNLVKSVQEGLLELYKAPNDYEVLLGNGGATAFWEMAVHCLIRNRSQHATFGEFGAKFAKAAKAAPFLQDPDIREAAAGSLAVCEKSEGIDLYAFPHNETSTGVMSPVRRVAPAEEALAVVDATSAAGGVCVDLAETDVYYFSPQKNFAADGGIWFAIISPAAVARIEEICASGRYIPEFLNLKVALDNSRKNQTLNTPALATLALMDEQIRWMNEHGGITWADARTKESSSRIYEWAQARPEAHPFVADPAHRSQVVATIDFDEQVDAAELAKTLRANGIVDVEPYRKLGKNQLRIACFTAVCPDDISALLNCIDYVIDHQQ